MPLSCRHLLRHVRNLFLPALLGGLAACGGGDEPPQAPNTRGDFRSVVVFGDSLSDVGTYAPATSLAGNGEPPYLGSRFTNNAAGSTVWVENIARSLGLQITPAELGFAGVSRPCPSADASCTGYAQGGARVSDPEGFGKAFGFLTVPANRQVAQHLARFGGFSARDLVLVAVGNNDALLAFEAHAALASATATEVTAGRLSPAEAEARLAADRAQALAAMGRAAGELATLVRGQILGKGGVYVAVLNLPDASLTPYGQAFPAALRPVLVALIEAFNQSLDAGLAGQPVARIDALGYFRATAADPARHGFVDNRTPVCDAQKIAALTQGRVSTGNSLFCNTTPGAPFNTLREGTDPERYQFADFIHPSTGGHRAFSQEVLMRLRALGWI